MKIILVEPFAHRPGHYSVEAWQLIQALSKLGVNIILVSFNGFINVDTKQIKEIGVRNFSFSSDSSLVVKKSYYYIKNLYCFPFVKLCLSWNH